MFLTRTVTGVVFGLVLLGTLYLGGVAWGLFVALAATVGFGEYVRLWRHTGSAVSPLLAFLGWVLTLAWVGLAVFAPSAAGSYTSPMLLVTVLAALTALVLSYPATSATGAIGVIAGSLYVGWTLSHLVLLRASGPPGLWRPLLVFAGVWATDVAAYLVGTTLGRHKLRPALSPGKSVEGAVGGLLGGMAAAWLVGLPLGLPIGFRLGLGAAMSVLGQIGDLAESALKRQAGLKDSGKILPGHGGVLDRFDSTLFVAPLVYYVLLWLGKGGGF
ncbi:MAG: phosphatidate cytidylyltransferase [Symbiobacteriia bacterium]